VSDVQWSLHRSTASCSKMINIVYLSCLLLPHMLLDIHQHGQQALLRLCVCFGSSAARSPSCSRQLW
jgi:hypothetical protein